MTLVKISLHCILKSNLELALSKEKTVLRVKICCVRMYMLKNMRFAIIFNMFTSLSFKKTTCFANVAKTIASTVNSYTKKYFTTSRIGSLSEKYFLISNEVKLL